MKIDLMTLLRLQEFKLKHNQNRKKENRLRSLTRPSPFFSIFMRLTFIRRRQRHNRRSNPPREAQHRTHRGGSGTPPNRRTVAINLHGGRN
jgi:hypothetical protein